MKTLKSMSNLFVVGLTSALLFTSCELAENLKQDEDILPNSFSVDIPASLSNQNSVKNGRVSGRVKTDTLQGNDIYLHLNTFIAVGEGAAHIVEGIIAGIRIYKIDRIQSLTYTSDDDHRAKNLVVLSNTEYEKQMWDYELIITDADSENQADGGKALQIFWNKSATVKGIAIVKPYNCDRIKNAGAKNAVFRIDYSEESALGYDAEMQVSISGLPLESPLDNPYSVNTLRMFAGKKGDVVDVYGNTNHPNAIFFSGNTGFNWAFVASGNDVKDIGVAEVGLPPSDLDKSNRDVLLKEYSIKNVFTSEITSVWPGIDQNLLAAYLSNTPAPGYFDNRHGFIAGGVSPGPDWDVLTSRLTKLSPYNPKITSEMVVTFK